MPGGGILRFVLGRRLLAMKDRQREEDLPRLCRLIIHAGDGQMILRHHIVRHTRWCWSQNSRHRNLILGGNQKDLGKVELVVLAGVLSRGKVDDSRMAGINKMK